MTQSKTRARIVGLSIAAVLLLLGASWGGATLGHSVLGSGHPAPSQEVVRSAGGSDPATELAAASASLPTAGSPSASAGVAPAITGPTWTQVVTPLPVAAFESAMVYDAADKEYLLFGGYNGTTISQQTWTYSPSGVWTPISVAGAPSAREGAEIAYDATDHYVVLFGGVSNTSTYLSDTWKFAGGKWTKLSPSKSPAAAAFGSMTYDAATGSVLLFGGETTGNTLLGTTWSYKGGSWTKLTPSASPSARITATLSYDAADGYPVLFGGLTTGSTSPSDTWNFSGGTWHRLSPSVVPPGRCYAAMAYDPIDQRVVLTTGFNVSTGTILSDTWEFAGGAWAKKATTYNPTARYFAASADGSNSTGMMLFGGANVAHGYSGDLWTFKKNDWTALHAMAPSPRAFEAMSWDATDRYVVMFGGEGSSGVVLGDTWKFAGGVWTPLHPKVHPPPLFGSSMAWDGTDGYVLLFGGANAYQYSSATWSFVHGKWTEVLAGPTGTPIGRIQAGMAYDAQDGYVVLFGGYNYSVYPYGALGDTWTYEGGVWNFTYTLAGPSPRSSPQMSYDSGDGVVLLFGGEAFNGTGSSTTMADTWIFSGGAWTNITTFVSGTPYGSLDGVMVDDTYDGYVLLLGGYNTTYGIFPFTWSYSGYVWKYVSVSSFPAYVYGEAMAYDPGMAEPVEFGGLNTTGFVTAETWAYTG